MPRSLKKGPFIDLHLLKKVETALEPKFQEHFIHAMALPNKVDPFEKLGKVVKLPPKKQTASADSTGSSGRPRRSGGRRGRR